MESPTCWKTALIDQTREILTSKPTFIPGVSKKLLKTVHTNHLLSTHLYGVQHSLNWKSTMQCSPFLTVFWDTLYLLHLLNSRPSGNFQKQNPDPPPGNFFELIPGGCLGGTQLESDSAEGAGKESPSYLRFREYNN